MKLSIKFYGAGRFCENPVRLYLIFAQHKNANYFISSKI